MLSMSSQSHFGGRREMICVEAQYFNLNKILLLAVGLWPQQTRFVRFRLIFFLGILTTATIFQFTVFFTSKWNSDLVIEILSVMFNFIFFEMHYTTFALKMKTVKHLLEQLQHVHNKLQDKYENAVMEKYVYIGKCYTAAFIIFGVCSVSASTAVEFLSSSHDVVPSTNVSRARRMQFVTEYFIDQKTYFSLIMLHINAAFCIGLFSVIAIGTTFFVYFQFTCGMFRISSYRIERAMRISRLKNIGVKNEKFIFEEIICAIDIHRQAMKLSELLVSKFETMVFCIAVIAVISLSLNLFRIFQISSSQVNINKLIFPFLCVSIYTSYIFLAGYTGQNITDHTNYVYVTAYSVQWYVTPLYIQKTILFLLQRGTKDFTLNIKGLIVGSLECIATLIKASISYFAVMCSIQ